MAFFVGILCFVVGVALGVAFKDLILAQIAKITKKNS